MAGPPFAEGRRWWRRFSNAVGRRVWYDPDTDYEYERDPNSGKGTWHEIDWRSDQYREIDRQTGQPVQGGEGRWRRLR